MQPAQLGKTQSLSIGELAVAVARTRRGNIVASAGIIGGLMGEWQVARTRIDQFIRPDLTLYPGFSGGALVDAAGGVVGLNTSGLLRGKPISDPLVHAVTSCRRNRCERSCGAPVCRAGNAAGSNSRVSSKEGRRERRRGFVGDARRVRRACRWAGVLLGDILLEMDGQSFTDLDDVNEALARKGVGQDVHTSLIRGGQRLSFTIRIGERPSR